MRFRLLAALWLLFAVLPAAAAAPVRTEHVEAQLIAERTAAEPGGALTVALRLRMIPHWHTYWRNPGDSGEPTAIEWHLPPGWSAGPIRWPAPQRLPIAHLVNYGYENEVLLLSDLTVPVQATGSAHVAARATWLVCNEDHCIPESGELSLALPIGPGVDSADAQAIWATRAALPVKAGADWRFAARRSDAGVDLEIVPPAGVAASGFRFFPYDEGKIRNAAAQTFDGTVLELVRSDQPVGGFHRVSGLLAADGLPRALEIDVPVALAPGDSGVAGLALAVVFAFLGGLILNLMPCVLPVLSIKILGFAQRNEGRGALRAHGLLYAAGVLTSFLAFAGVLLALKGAGHELGWGFQLQSPVFVAALAALFLVLALSLSGIVDLSFLVPSGLAGVALKSRRLDAFATGVLAVAVASPCTAPFMGAALGYALAGDAADALAVFGALGAGMALPYVALAWNPRWLARLPKPGPWMTRFKQALAVPLYATVLWLGWVLAIQAGVLAPASDWEPYTPAALHKYERQGRTVFVDYTAAWCVTCQVNKQLVLEQPEVRDALRSSGMALLRADWTRRDETITRALEQLGRKGVPVYAIYRPGEAPELLPEILTRDTVLTALKPNS